MCSFCPDIALDPLGHRAVTCRHGETWSSAIIDYGSGGGTVGGGGEGGATLPGRIIT